MKLTLRKDIAGERAAAIARVNARAGALRGRVVTVIPGQEMIYLEKASEARRYLAAYPAPEDIPGALDADPATGFPFLCAELGITADDPHALALIWIGGASLFRQIGAAIETIRLGAVAAIEAAASPVGIAAAEAAAEAAFALVFG
ncbi:hypothetical protein [Amaricoccus sp.]|uniref:hypothetical protein n=1 Tax=Amaricoccus sp. TaxID=1872485 RepID=UPI00261D20A0|nr:hypothetical protein [uncultured Amaricoccus sp.]